MEAEGSNPSNPTKAKSPDDGELSRFRSGRSHHAFSPTCTCTSRTGQSSPGAGGAPLGSASVDRARYIDALLTANAGAIEPLLAIATS